MNETPDKFVLVCGTGRTVSRAKRRAARMIGTTLADAGLGLVTGNSTGIDKWTAAAFCAERIARGEPIAGAFFQVCLQGMRFFGGLPWPGFRAPPECRIAVPNVEAWKREALARSHAAVMVAGRHGTLDIARRFIERGCPVFPLPFTGGNSDSVFQDILKTWQGYPVPGLSRTQFLRLAEPWVIGTGALANLLRGTLAETHDVFISYRRSDAPAAAGRIASDLAEHFGQRRVFLDIHGIAPSRAWDQSIEGALQRCKAGVVVIGRNWLAPGPDGRATRLNDEDDIVRKEIAELLRARKAVFPVLVEGAKLPEASELPESLQPLLHFQATTIDNGGWGVTMHLLISEIGAVIQSAEQRGLDTASSPGAADARALVAPRLTPQTSEEPWFGALEPRRILPAPEPFAAEPRRRGA